MKPSKITHIEEWQKTTTILWQLREAKKKHNIERKTLFAILQCEWFGFYHTQCFMEPSSQLPQLAVPLICLWIDDKRWPHIHIHSTHFMHRRSILTSGEQQQQQQWNAQFSYTRFISISAYFFNMSAILHRSQRYLFTIYSSFCLICRVAISLLLLATMRLFASVVSNFQYQNPYSFLLSTTKSYQLWRSLFRLLSLTLCKNVIQFAFK